MTSPVKLTTYEEALLKALPDNEIRHDFERTGFPHRRVESWKWSDLKNMTRDLEYPEQKVGSSQAAITQHTMGQLASSFSDTETHVLKDGDSLQIEAPSSGHKVYDIRIDKGASVQLNELYTFGSKTLTNVFVQLSLGRQSRLDRIIQQDGDASSVGVVTSEIILEPEAQLTQVVLGFGGKLVRLETHIDHPGEKARVDLNTAYLLTQGRHFDQTSVIHHKGPGGQTRQLCKGAVAAKGVGIFQGKFHVDQSAQKTDAEMQHRGLLLEDGAVINAKPELEIYADDVVCAHGNAIGAMDEEALFYMRQRGLNESSARALLTESFLAEPLETIGEENIRQLCLKTLSQRLRQLV